MVTLAMVLSWVESQIPAFTSLPGMKLGLTNLVVMVALYRLGLGEAVFINMIRILLVGLTFGNTFSIACSLAGGLLSGGIMILMKKSGRFRMITVSLAGGVLHNIGQILIVMLLLHTKAVLYYLPMLWISGILAGCAVGILCEHVVKRLPEIKTVVCD